MSQVLELTLRDDFRGLARIAGEVAAFLDGQPIPSNLAAGAGLALEEILNNVIKYGFRQTKRHEFQVRVEVENQEVVICCLDDGHRFNPRLQFLPDGDLAAGGQEESGGRGTYPALNLAYFLKYERKEGKNLLTMRLKRQGA
jgi:anti-sigma regulatory factor (Ser/Thr protein kinase)